MLGGPENFFTIDKFSLFISFTIDKFNCNYCLSNQPMKMTQVVIVTSLIISKILVFQEKLYVSI